MTSTPVPSTARVTPPASRAPRWAAASTPRARPLTTTTPAWARSAASRSATASPYGVGRRAPTIATRGPGGGGQAPRARRSVSGGVGILEPVAEGFHDVPLLEVGGPFQVADRPGHPPGAVEATRGEAAQRRPALQRAAGRRREGGVAPELGRLERRVQAALAVELPAAGGDHPCPDGG